MRRHWNGEIEQLMRMLFYFRRNAQPYSNRDAKYILNSEYELHYGRKGHIAIGGIQRKGVFIFAIELVEPAPQMLVYPTSYIYNAGTYRPVFNLAKDHGWRP